MYKKKCDKIFENIIFGFKNTNEHFKYYVIFLYYYMISIIFSYDELTDYFVASSLNHFYYSIFLKDKIIIEVFLYNLYIIYHKFN
jgi:hypothetical protein